MMRVIRRRLPSHQYKKDRQGGEEEGRGILLTVSVFVSVCTNVVNRHDSFVWGIYSRYCKGKRHHRPPVLPESDASGILAKRCPLSNFLPRTSASRTNVWIAYKILLPLLFMSATTVSRMVRAHRSRC